jgi:hypothetical protein
MMFVAIIIVCSEKHKQTHSVGKILSSIYKQTVHGFITVFQICC